MTHKANNSFSYTKQDKSFAIQTDNHMMTKDADKFTRKQEIERK